jgi:hypothetical protein
MNGLNVMMLVVLPLLGALWFIVGGKPKNYWLLILCIPAVNFMVFCGVLGYIIICGPFLLHDYIKYGTIEKNVIREIVKKKSTD